MKTPREILLAQHRAANPKLDALRQSIVAAPRQSAANNDSQASTLFQTFWRELFFSARRTWTGMAAIWAFILLVNFSQQDKVNSTTGRTVHSSGPVMSLQAQLRWVNENEHFADRTLPPEADRPRNFSPKPRTAITITVTV